MSQGTLWGVWVVTGEGGAFLPDMMNESEP